jgi:hypothetical protein
MDKINLGGFPSIIYITNKNKKRREFKKIIEKNIDKISSNKINIINIKNIIKDSNKNIN